MEKRGQWRTWVRLTSNGLPFGEGISRIALATRHIDESSGVAAAIVGRNLSLQSVYGSPDNGVTWSDLRPQDIVPGICGDQGDFNLALEFRP